MLQIVVQRAQALDARHVQHESHVVDPWPIWIFRQRQLGTHPPIIRDTKLQHGEVQVGARGRTYASQASWGCRGSEAALRGETFGWGRRGLGAVRRISYVYNWQDGRNAPKRVNARHRGRDCMR